MANRVKSLGLLALVCSAPSMAQVSHVSVNSRMFELGGYPKLRVNVIADNQDMSRLEFVVQQAGGEEKLMVEELNRFLVLLTGVEDVKDDKAKLLVREYRLDRWYEVKSINLFGEAKPTSAALSMSAASGSKNTTTALVQKRADKVNVQSVKVAAESTSVVGAKTATAVIAAANTHVDTHVNTKPTVPAPEVVTGFKFPEAANEQNTQVAEAKPVAKTSEPVAVKTTAVETVMSESVAVKTTPVETVVPETVMSEVVATETAKTTNSELKANAAETSPTASQTPEHCQLTYLAGETLWRIANRYANDWDVSVYGAMLAIYEANPAAFSKNKINALKCNAALSCPSKMILAQHANAKEAQAMFEAKEAGK
ncbi:FimV/HubP family polar landmark protein [Shewanella baltica]|uniref:FimV/HubP family polar landmark protein n=1 Tax=Shewanella baltica TaxID=62322 RepID=UPI00217DA661|nr:FimV/HubP family polar landmark protein [Shewanella baltica]MCS6192398.1 fimbrial protein FimV [Shewanella baltica]